MKILVFTEGTITIHSMIKEFEGINHLPDNIEKLKNL